MLATRTLQRTVRISRSALLIAALGTLAFAGPGSAQESMCTERFQEDTATCDDRFERCTLLALGAGAVGGATGGPMGAAGGAGFAMAGCVDDKVACIEDAGTAFSRCAADELEEMMIRVWEEIEMWERMRGDPFDPEEDCISIPGLGRAGNCEP